MTMSWLELGHFWYKPVITVFVRNSRYSHELIARDRFFTVACPTDNSMDKQLEVCGCKSGRDMNKIEALGLKILPSRAGGVGSIDGPLIHFECRVLGETEIPSNFDFVASNIRERFYTKDKYVELGDKTDHTAYFGEVLTAYRT
ncbi:hypothetical protein SDC9_179886 [bioreactor metagenome]|uniref:Flavin reductase like domain-containing protein n=1 Tax=bioreactor metagenome TaxID=1076179 RepID=A0A645H096_9ZZZZ